jgi:hypothetical protein
MERNLDRRVEAVVPIEDPEARARIEAVIDAMLADDRHSWQLGPDSQWRRTEDLTGRPGTNDVFDVLKAAALTSSTTRREAPGDALRVDGRDGGGAAKRPRANRRRVATRSESR